MKKINFLLYAAAISILYFFVITSFGECLPILKWIIFIVLAVGLFLGLVLLNKLKEGIFENVVVVQIPSIVVICVNLIAVTYFAVFHTIPFSGLACLIIACIECVLLIISGIAAIAGRNR